MVSKVVKIFRKIFHPKINSVSGASSDSNIIMPEKSLPENDKMKGLKVEHNQDNTKGSMKVDNYFGYEGLRSIIVLNHQNGGSDYEQIPQGSHNDVRDARNCDISKLNLSEEQLLNLTIDKTTVLSEQQKEIISKYQEKMKDPGLGVKDLHLQGITGKGVKIAIIDQPLGEHNEYSGNLIHHEIVGDIPSYFPAQMHGSAVTSIVLGKETGVAPGAELVYFSKWSVSSDPQIIQEYKNNVIKVNSELSARANNPKQKEFYQEILEIQLKDIDDSGVVLINKPYTDAINKVLEINKSLPDNEKISVISISWGFDDFAPDYKELVEAIRKAQKEGVFVISTALEDFYGFHFNGANRDPKQNPNSAQSYEAGAWWKNDEDKYKSCDETLLVPMDHRTIADFHDKESFRYEGNDGGMSWAVPYLAGVYALAKQVQPDINPQDFYNLALETSDECRNNDTNKLAGRLINPQRLINALRKPKLSEQ